MKRVFPRKKLYKLKDITMIKALKEGTHTG